MTSMSLSTRLLCGNRVLDLAHTHVMGILNVTPDSFSDGGRFSQSDAALHHAEAMVAAGATLIDVGGESTRPGARVVSPLEELERVAPIVERIARELDVIISVDTSTPSVMRETARLGAGLINDVRSLQRDGALDAAAATGLPVCLMHMRGEPANMQDSPHYDDLVGEVSDFLAERIAQCASVGIAAEKIVLDPGIGFGKNKDHTVAILKGLERFASLGRPLYVGLSRKSMFREILGLELEQRAEATRLAVALLAARGIPYHRVHDVAGCAQALRLVEAMTPLA